MSREEGVKKPQGLPMVVKWLPQTFRAAASGKAGGLDDFAGEDRGSD